MAKKSQSENLDFNHTILSELPVGIAIYDQQWRYVYANQALLSMLDTSNKKLLSQKFQKVEAWKTFSLFSDAKNTYGDGTIHCQKNA